MNQSGLPGSSLIWRDVGNLWNDGIKMRILNGLNCVFCSVGSIQWMKQGLSNETGWINIDLRKFKQRTSLIFKGHVSKIFIWNAFGQDYRSASVSKMSNAKYESALAEVHTFRQYSELWMHFLKLDKGESFMPFQNSARHWWRWKVLFRSSVSPLKQTHQIVNSPCLSAWTSYRKVALWIQISPNNSVSSSLRKYLSFPRRRSQTNQRV